MNLVSISDGEQLTVSLLNYGARITAIEFDGKAVALGYKQIEEYLTDAYYMGATIGPITNRIAKARLQVNNDGFELPTNEGNNCLHSGGKQGFDKQTWKVNSQSDQAVEFELQYDLAKIGMRGRLKTLAHYSVAQGALTVEYISTASRVCYINLTNHVYLNLSGDCNNSNIQDHQFELFATSFVNVDSENIPTGSLSKLAEPLKYSLGDKPPYPEFAGLCDHHFNVQGPLMMRAESKHSGIKLEVRGNSPGFQFYTGKFLASPFSASAGFCVETQLSPDAINQRNFYAPLLTPAEARRQTSVYTFSR
ncbi:MAG: aldose 1-epimerase [Cryomorphaceae bacterium]|jgi:aldose 1-epimerase